eukprot:257242-Pelagomonas_calceolata.AAC.3
MRKGNKATLFLVPHPSPPQAHLRGQPHASSGRMQQQQQQLVEHVAHSGGSVRLVHPCADYGTETMYASMTYLQSTHAPASRERLKQT